MTRKKTIVMSLAIAMLAGLVFSVVFVSAAWNTQIKNGTFDAPYKGIRMPAKYSNGFIKTSSTKVVVEKGKILNDTQVRNMFNNFDADYRAFKSAHPGSSISRFYARSDTSEQNDSSMIGYQDFQDLLGHTTDSNKYARWNTFNLNDPENKEGQVVIRIKNVQYYDHIKRQTEDIDVVVTFTGWNKATASSGTESTALVENYSAREDSDPYLIISVTGGGLPGIRIARLENVTYSVRFEKDGSSYPLNTNMTATDIDVQQRVKLSSRSTENVPYLIVHNNTNFGNNDQIKSGENQFTFQDRSASAVNRPNDPRDAFALYLDTSSGYSTEFQSGYYGSGGYSYFAQTSAAMAYYVPNDPYKTVADYDEGENDDGDNIPHRRSPGSRTGIPGINDSDTPAQKWKKVRSLKKSQMVNKSGGAKLRDMTISNVEGIITFQVRHRVTDDLSEETMFRKYLFKDKVDSAFTIIEAKMNSANAQYFTVSKDNTTNLVTASLKDEYCKGGNSVKAGVKRIKGSEHTLTIKCRIKEGIDISDYINDQTSGANNGDSRFIIVPNTGQVAIKDDGPDWTAGQTEDDADQYVKSTDTTFTAYALPGNETPQKIVADNDEKEGVTSGGEQDPTNGNKIRKERPDDFDYSKAKSYTGDDPARPLKDLKDTNSIDTRGRTVTYKIRHKVNKGFGNLITFNSYVITDNVDPAWQIKEAYMDEDVVGGSDGSTTLKPESQRSFEQVIDSGNPNKIQFRARSAALSDDDFYGRSHVLVIKVRIKEKSEFSDLTGYLNSSKRCIIIPNTAHLKITSPEVGTITDEDTDEMYSTYQIPKPKKRPVEKYVSDADNRKTLNDKGTEVFNSLKKDNLKENTIDNYNRSFKYHITNTVSDGYVPYWYFNKYEITDAVPDIIKIVSGSFRAYEVSWKEGDAAEGDSYGKRKDVTTKFESVIGTNNGLADRKITITAKDSALKEADFYDCKRYIFEFDAQIDHVNYNTWEKVKTWASQNNRMLTWKNTAKLKISDNEYDGYAGDDEKFNAANWEDTTNEVLTHADLPKPAKTTPFKTVSDKDGKTLTGEGEEIRVNENTLRKPDDKYTYHVRQRLGGGGADIWTEGAYSPYWKFKSFVISDRVEALLHIKSARVYQYTWSKDGQPGRDPGSSAIDGGTDVSGLFDISIDNNTHTVKATAKPAALAGANTDDLSFYNVKLYELRFECEIDTVKYDSEESLAKWAAENDHGTKNVRLRWPNKANVAITDEADPCDPESEKGKGIWNKETNTVFTNVWVGTIGEGDDVSKPKPPGIELTKTVKPYEFQVGDEISYTVTIRQTNPDAVSYKVVAIDTDFPAGFKIDDKSLKAELSGRNRKREGEFIGKINPVSSEGTEGFRFDTDYLYHGEIVTINFSGRVGNSLNGNVVPNKVTGRSWGAHDPDNESGWDMAQTSVYINSPKLDITKDCDKKPDADGRIRLNKGDTVHFTSRIRNINQGTFMRNIYAVDVVETNGLTIKPGTIKVRVNSRTDTERMISVDDLDEGKAYKIEPFRKGEKSVAVDNNLGGRLGSRAMEDYEIQTSEEEADNTGDQLPSDNHGGFVIKLLGKYRNIGYMDKKIPATDDETFDKVRDKKGRDVNYMKGTEMEAAENEQVKYGSSAYIKDYQNLNLQNLIEISYDCEVTDDGLTEIGNFIRVPATENSNNDLINNDDSIPSGGDYADTSRELKTDPPGGDTDKIVDEETADKDAVLHYTVSGENTGKEIIKDPVLEDELVTKNLEFDKESFEVFRNETGDDNKLTAEKYNIEFNDENYSFKVKVPGAELKTGDKIIVKYSGKVTKDIKTTNPNNRRVQELTEEEVVHNKVTFMGKHANVWTPNNEPGDPNPKLTKTVREKKTQPGGILHYTVVGENVSGTTAKQVVFRDEIKTKNLEYDQNSFDIRFIRGGDKAETDLTSELKYKIEFSDDCFVLKTGKDLEKGDKILISYSGRVRQDVSEKTESKTVDNVVVMTGSNFDSLQDQKTVPFGDPGIEKTAQVQYTAEGKVIPYIAVFINTDDEVWRNVVLTDDILTKNAEYNKDFRIYINDNEITKDCSIEYGDHNAIIRTGKDISKGQTIKAEYSVTTTDGEWVDNEFIAKDAEGKNAHAFEKVPPVTHEKAVDKEEHDGPDGERNVLGYTLTSKHNGKDRPLNNVVITDTVLSKNLKFNDDIKVMKSGNDITEECKIWIAEDRMSFEIRLKDPLAPGETVITTYTGNVTDLHKVDNETVLTADGIDGIKDEKSVHGPEVKPENPKIPDDPEEPEEPDPPEVTEEPEEPEIPEVPAEPNEENNPEKEEIIKLPDKPVIKKPEKPPVIKKKAVKKAVKDGSLKHSKRVMDKYTSKLPDADGGGL